MVLVPESQCSRQEVRQSIAAQFWGQHASGVRTLDSMSRLMPCEPPPLPQNAASGLSRAQQLLAFQAVAFPALPAYNPAQGGLVFDRALVRAGGKHWWTVILGRVRAQRAWSFHRDGQRTVDALKHSDNFAVASSSRFKFGRGTTLQTNVEAPDFQAAAAASSAAVASARGHSSSGATREAPPVLRGTAVLKQDVADHHLALTAAVNQEYVGSASVYSEVPLTASLDFRSKTRADGLQYRAGVHYVHAPDSSLSQDADDSGASPSASLRSALHVQGAVAVEGEAVLWHPSLPRSRSAVTSSPSADAAVDNSNESSMDAASGAATDGSSAVSESPQAPLLPFPDNIPRGEAGGADAWSPAVPQPGHWQAAASSGNRREAGARDAPRPKFVRTSSGFERPGESDWEDYHQGPLETMATSHGDVTRRRVDSLWKTQPMRSRLPAPESWRRFRAAYHAGDDSSDSDGSSRVEDDSPLLKIKFPRPDDVQQGVATAKRRVDRVGQLTDAARRSVRSGTLAHFLDALRGRSTGRRTRRPYSPWLAQPYAKVNGAIGCLARMPLPPNLSALASTLEPSGELQGGNHDGAAGGLSAVSSLSSRFRNGWSPYVRETSLRIFASAGASTQVGRFTRPVMDFTSISARLDAGLTSQHTGGGGMGEVGAVPQSAFALEGRNIWHAATLSVAQQLIGPVRVRADMRVSLHVPGGYSPEDGDRASLRSMYTASVGVRPTVLDRIVGLDWMLPHSAGSGRFCIWWSPSRKEAMAEFRLC